MTENELQKPWGRLIDEGRRRTGLSVRKAASAAGISEGRWRQIVNGYQSAGNGQTITVDGPDDTVARMAEVAGVTPDELRSAGRDRAAAVLEGLLAPLDAEMAEAMQHAVVLTLNARLRDFTDTELIREIEARHLYMAAQLHAGGAQTLGWRLDSAGLLEMVSRTNAGRV
jgi:hypothetical protein